MKIADIRTIVLSCRCDPPYASAAGVQSQRAALLVEIETDSGVVGIGEAGIGGGVTATVIEKSLKPLLVGQDPLLIERLWQTMFARTRQYGRRGLVMQAISGIDIALWDIAGKIAKLPVYRSSARAATASRPMPAAASIRRANRPPISPVKRTATAPAVSRA